jgi:hypothetical protein
LGPLLFLVLLEIHILADMFGLAVAAANECLTLKQIGNGYNHRAITLTKWKNKKKSKNQLNSCRKKISCKKTKEK